MPYIQEDFDNSFLSDEYLLRENINYLLEHHEEAVERRSGRKPNGRPIQLFQNGKVRIEFLATYDSIKQAYLAVRQICNAS